MVVLTAMISGFQAEAVEATPTIDTQESRAPITIISITPVLMSLVMYVKSLLEVSSNVPIVRIVAPIACTSDHCNNIDTLKVTLETIFMSCSNSNYQRIQQNKLLCITFHLSLPPPLSLSLSTYKEEYVDAA